ncbi:MAG: ABC transporter ATP-binding protein [Gammaproteobacteria bacterium]|nr:ABC transporter ATP-binding protein [Gammaproteobacteria bacterium]
MTLALEINDLKKTYANGFEALKGIHFSVEHGDFFALLGPNGAGKSTTIGIISTLIKKTSGNVNIYGHDIERFPVKAKSLLGVVPQEMNMSVFNKVFDIVYNQAGYYGVERKLAKQRTEKLLKALGLWEKRDVTLRQISGGMKRRLMIARALVHQPKFLILDEPTAGVDIELRRSMWEFLQEINQRGTTIILTTHYLEEAEQLCNKIAIIDHGQIIKNTDKKTLLSELNQQTIILDVKEPCTVLPELFPYTARLIDTTSIEVDILDTQDINSLFSLLSQQNIQVMSLRNKSNRLEELFIRLIGKK